MPDQQGELKKDLLSAIEANAELGDSCKRLGLEFMQLSRISGQPLGCVLHRNQEGSEFSS